MREMSSPRRWIPIIFLGYTVTVLGIGTVAAVDKNERFAIKGVGANSCAVFREMSAKDPEAYRQFGGWMNGYISALNETTPETFDLINFEDADTLIAYVSNYCLENPEHRFMFAVKGVAAALERSKITEQGQYIVFNGIDQVSLHQQTLDWVVRELTALEYLPPEALDIQSQRTIIAKALKSYQKDNSLPETGLPTQETLVRLLHKPSNQN